MSRVSRRDFLVKGAVGLGVAVASELCVGGLMEAYAAAPVSDGAKEKGMPHVNVKLWPGRSEEEKRLLADAITEDVVRITGSSRSSVSVSIEDIPSGEWKERVYDPEIRDKADILYKKPGYSM